MKYLKNNSKNMKVINLKGKKAIKIIPTKTVPVEDDDYKEALTSKVVVAWIKDGDLELVTAPKVKKVVAKKETAKDEEKTETKTEEK